MDYPTQKEFSNSDHDIMTLARSNKQKTNKQTNKLNFII